MAAVDKLVKEANQIIAKFDETLLIGPSHFMTKELTYEWLLIIWRYSIVPEVGIAALLYMLCIVSKRAVMCESRRFESV